MTLLEQIKADRNLACAKAQDAIELIRQNRLTEADIALQEAREACGAAKFLQGAGDEEALR